MGRAYGVWSVDLKRVDLPLLSRRKFDLLITSLRAWPFAEVYCSQAEFERALKFLVVKTLWLPSRKLMSLLSSVLKTFLSVDGRGNDLKTF